MSSRWQTSLALALVSMVMSSHSGFSQDGTPNASPTSPATTVASLPGQNLRGVRYCEVLVPELGDGHDGMALKVYTTQGLNDCPQELWNTIDARTEARRLGVPLVFKNGPRHVAYDQISAQIDGTVESFQGLDMQLVATLELPPGATPQDRAPYAGMTVARNTEYVYLAGMPVFELIAPDDSVYVMQTYVAANDPNGDLSGLAGLADRLSLPAGWTYLEVVPDQDIHATTIDGQATVIRDDLENTYQLLSVGSGTPVPAR